MNFELAWKQYAKSEMDAEGVLGVLVHIHGDWMGLRARWRRVLTALPSDEVTRRTP